MDADITVRLSRRDDLAAVDALLARSYPALLCADYPPSVLVTALPLIARANPSLVGSGGYFVAVTASGTVLGAGGCTMAAPPGVIGAHGGLGHVRHVITDHRHVRRGIGRALMERAMAEAQERGARILDCLSTRTAVPFYAALGFDTLGPREIDLRPGIRFPVIHMQKRM